MKKALVDVQKPDKGIIVTAELVWEQKKWELGYWFRLPALILHGINLDNCPFFPDS